MPRIDWTKGIGQVLANVVGYVQVGTNEILLMQEYYHINVMIKQIMFLVKENLLSVERLELSHYHLQLLKLYLKLLI